MRSRALGFAPSGFFFLQSRRQSKSRGLISGQISSPLSTGTLVPGATPTGSATAILCTPWSLAEALPPPAKIAHCHLSLNISNTADLGTTGMTRPNDCVPPRWNSKVYHYARRFQNGFPRTANPRLRSNPVATWVRTGTAATTTISPSTMDYLGAADPPAPTQHRWEAANRLRFAIQSACLDPCAKCWALFSRVFIASGTMTGESRLVLIRSEICPCWVG